LGSPPLLVLTPARPAKKKRGPIYSGVGGEEAAEKFSGPEILVLLVSLYLYFVNSIVFGLACTFSL
jgi:hypothetical protein